MRRAPRYASAAPAALRRRVAHFQPIGVHCSVLDAGSAREDGISRALWQGLEFVRYLLSSRWLGRPDIQPCIMRCTVLYKAPRRE